MVIFLLPNWMVLVYDYFLFQQKNYLDVYRFESWGGSLIPTYVQGQQVATIFILQYIKLDFGACILSLFSIMSHMLIHFIKKQYFVLSVG